MWKAPQALVAGVMNEYRAEPARQPSIVRQELWVCSEWCCCNMPNMNFSTLPPPFHAEAQKGLCSRTQCSSVCINNSLAITTEPFSLVNNYCCWLTLAARHGVSKKEGRIIYCCDMPLWPLDFSFYCAVQNSREKYELWPPLTMSYSTILLGCLCWP